MTIFSFISSDVDNNLSVKLVSPPKAASLMYTNANGKNIILNNVIHVRNIEAETHQEIKD